MLTLDREIRFQGRTSDALWPEGKEERKEGRRPTPMRRENDKKLAAAVEGRANEKIVQWHDISICSMSLFFVMCDSSFDSSAILLRHESELSAEIHIKV